jgi:hypothetical protein
MNEDVKCNESYQTHHRYRQNQRRAFHENLHVEFLAR